MVASLSKAIGAPSMMVVLCDRFGSLDTERTEDKPSSSSSWVKSGIPSLDFDPTSDRKSMGEAERLKMQAEMLKLQAEKLRLEAEREQLMMEREAALKKEVSNHRGCSTYSVVIMRERGNKA